MTSEETETENCEFCGETKAVATGLYGCPVCHGEGLKDSQVDNVKIYDDGRFYYGGNCNAGRLQR